MVALTPQSAQLIALGVQEAFALATQLIARHQAAGTPIPPADQLHDLLKADGTAQLNAENAYLAAHGAPTVAVATTPAPLPTKG